MAVGATEGRPGELLPGEDPEVSDPVELQHWVSIYEERLAICKRRTRRARDAQAQVQRLEYLQWVRSRLDFWRDRHARYAGLRLDPATREMSGRAGTVALTRREFELLSYLADHPGRHVPAGLLVARAWPDADLCEEQLRTYVGRLRRKMARVGTPCRLVAERPRGYVLLFDEDVAATASASSAS